jgi:dihydroorotase-like cyclic amidohydrolase
LSKNTPFNKTAVKGKAIFTIAQGEIAYADESVVYQ